MFKCSVCEKEFEDDSVNTCNCGGGVVFANDQDHFDWMNEYDSDGF